MSCTAAARIALVASLAAVLLFVPAANATADAAKVKRCRPFTVLTGTGAGGDEYTYRATHVRRSARLRCRKARNLLRAAYGRGPLKIVKKVYVRDADGNPVGRPTYWVRGGWRCSNGAGGAACWNAKRPRFNVIPSDGAAHRMSVKAWVGIGTS